MPHDVILNRRQTDVQNEIFSVQKLELVLFGVFLNTVLYRELERDYRALKLFEILIVLVSKDSTVGMFFHIWNQIGASHH
jgi:hypothetical protein